MGGWRGRLIERTLNVGEHLQSHSQLPTKGSTQTRRRLPRNGSGGRMKHNWFMDIRHFLFGHQSIWGDWLEFTEHDGCSAHAKCKYCGMEGMIDSQGNLF